MAVCEMCGRAGGLVSADVEGVELKVCQNCSKYGTVRKSFPTQRGSHSIPARVERDVPAFRVREDYATLLRKAREARGLNQEDFAKLLTEKESFVAKWEAGAYKPDLEVATKLGRILNITLVEREEEGDASVAQKKKDPNVLTLGDFIKVKNRK